MNYYLIVSSFAVTLITCFFVVAVLLKGARIGKNRTFCFFAASVGSWSFTHMMWQLANTEEQAVFWLQLVVIASSFIPYTYLHFVNEVTGKSNRPLMALGYTIAVFVSIAGLNGLVFTGVEPRMDFSYWPVMGPIFPLYFGGFAIIVCYCFYLLIKQYNSASPKIKNQNKYLIIGTAIGFLGGGTNFPLWMDIPLPPIGHGLSVFYILGIGYSVVKYRLLDFNEFAIRASGILLAAILLGLGFSVCFYLFSRPAFPLGLHLNPLGLLLFFTLQTAILIMVAPSLFRWINRFLQLQFIPEKLHFRKELGELVNNVVIAPDVNRPLEEITHRLREILLADHVAIFVRHTFGEGFYRLVENGTRKTPSELTEDATKPLISLLQRHPHAIALEDKIEANGWTSEITLKQLHRHNFPIKGNDLIQPIMTADTVFGFILIGASENLAACGQLDFLLLDNLASRICLLLKSAELERTTNQMEKLVSLGTMAAGLSHELRNPLVSVRTLAAFMARSPDTLQLDPEFGKIVCRDIKRISAIVESVAAFAQNSRPTLSPVNCNSLFDELEELYRNEFEVNRIEWTVVNDPSVPEVLSNYEQLMQVLRNLVENAIHAISEWDKRPQLGRITIQCNPTTNTVADKIEAVEIQLSDNGIGMEAGFMQSIFDPFVTSRDTGMREESAGTGLGLAIVKKIIEQHHGRISVVSSPGAGSVFTIILPAAY